MKKWTVMLIPHDRGSSRTLNLSAYQVWLVVALLVTLSFTTSFFFKRHQTFVKEVARLHQTKRDLEVQYAKQFSAVKEGEFTPQERIELEKRIRAEYEARDAAITARLSDLKDLEDQARAMTGLTPRTSLKDMGLTPAVGGKGGGQGSLGLVAYEETEEAISSPSVIYGLSQPSADLIIQEINLRTESLKELVRGLKAREQQVARVPSIWPTFARNRDLSSPFGFRKDPYGRRIEHHDGADISAPYGSDIHGTAAGVVVYSGFDGGGLGNLIKIDHGNGVETWYGHLASRSVRKGETVDRKQVIGALGSTGRSTGPHVHYEVHVKGNPVDPAKYLKD